MAKLRYAVVQFAEEWKVVSGRSRMGHFATQALALNAGARLAREAMAAGHDVELLVQDWASCLLSYDVLPTASYLDEIQGGSSGPADEGPSQPGTRALEL
ncbi:MAG TPA: hypothetical protein VL460_11435 [Caulobacteraceae bacterium]|jgi:hypothetical protein|nr:hypothetical protein [Caulobacteraceae bacterium]